MNILIVEDEDFLSRALKDNLEFENFQAEIVRNGEDAMRRLDQAKPDIVLLDLLLPKKDGFAVLEEMRKNSFWKHIPVIVLSNLGGKKDIERAMRLGANDYLIKSQHPIDEVVGKVKEYLAVRRSVKTAVGT